MGKLFGRLRNMLFFVILLILNISCLKIDLWGSPNNQQVPEPEYSNVKLPIGMNLSTVNYYDPSIVFTDAMTTASSLLTFENDEWDSGVIEEILCDINGYPIGIPQHTSSGEDTKVRFLINDHYKGRYRILFDGNGMLGGNTRRDTEGYYIDLSGNGYNVWIDILYSDPEDYIRNMKILPDELAYDSYPTFLEDYLKGLEPFSTLRFMDWVNSNYTMQRNWSDRVSNDFYSQGVNGCSFDYAIELCNILKKDAWICIPYQASDDYIKMLAQLWKDNLNPNQKIYLEFSNELWNWIFPQAHYVDENAPGAVDRYISADLANIAPPGESFPLKGAYMMARTFRIWESIFGADSDRLVRVATGQQAWVGNSDGILDYLFNVDGIGCDAFAVGGYFQYSEKNHNDWLEKGELLNFEKIYYDTYNTFTETTVEWVIDTASIVNKYNIDYLVYEGGQHMQPWNQEEWNYNEVLWDFQKSDFIYKLYMHNFIIHTDPRVKCKLFMAYTYISPRKSKWGSWGHLENLAQISQNDYSNAPKYKALIDVNEP